MVDIKEKEPCIEILYPLLIHYSPEAAVLYGYLKNLYIKALNASGSNRPKGFTLQLERWDIQDQTGLSAGKQVDAETDLNGAGLVNGFQLKNQKIEYYIHPQNEEKLRRFVYSMRNKWHVYTGDENEK